MINVYSHRGNCREALENSWQAFHLSNELGIWGVEFDVHLTADKELVVIHDRELKRTASKTGLVGKLTRKQLEKIPLKNGEQIPFLDEIFSTFLPKLELNVELKTYSKATAEAVVKYLKHTKYPQRVLISSKSLSVLGYLSRMIPEIRLGHVFEGSRIPGPFTSYEKDLDHVAKQLPSLEAIHPDIRLIDRDFVALCRRHKWRMNPWFPLAEEKRLPDELWESLLEYDIEGIITNEPRAFVAWHHQQLALKKSS